MDIEKAKQLNTRVINNIHDCIEMSERHLCGVYINNPHMVVNAVTKTVYLHRPAWDELIYYHANHQEPGFPEDYRNKNISSICQFEIKDIKEFCGLGLQRYPEQLEKYLKDNNVK